MKTLYLLAVSALLLGCATRPVSVVRTVEVQVPVPTKYVAPDELLTCGHIKPEFRFVDSAVGAALTKEDQPKFVAWVEDKDRCIDALQGWAK